MLLCVTQLPHPPAPLVTCLESEVNVAVAFNGRSGLLVEYCLFVSKCLQEFDATYVIEWDGACKVCCLVRFRCFRNLLLAVEHRLTSPVISMMTCSTTVPRSQLHLEKTPN